MDLRPAAVVARFRGKTVRYLGLSAIGTILTQVQIFLYVQALGWNGALANFVAVSVSTVPGYFLAKYWVWQQRAGQGSARREALPFWVLNLAGLALSTVFAAIADHYSSEWWAISLANLAGFGVLWVAKFLILDEYLFKSDPPLVEI